MITAKRMRVKLKIKKPVSGGFSLIEVVISIALIGIALLGLAQLFTFSVLNNARAERLTSATFLAQQRIDSLRNLTSTELSALGQSPIDEALDVNLDGIVDYRRVTALSSSGSTWNVRILIYSSEQVGVPVGSLVQNPARYRVRAEVGTVISR